MGTMIGTGNDVVTFLKDQHKQVKALFDRVISASGSERQSAFYSLRRLMAVHETAEEEIVHPAARRAVPNGKAIVEAHLREENEAKRVLTELESLDVDSPEFDTKLRTLRSKVIAHAESEEKLEFEQLGAILDTERLERMRTAAEFAENVAPTRPHAGIESATGNLLVGPFASMLDRARDAFTKH